MSGPSDEAAAYRMQLEKLPKVRLASPNPSLSPSPGLGPPQGSGEKGM